MSEVSIIILNWNTYNLVKECIESVQEQGSGVDYEIVLADNGSTDGSIERIEEEYPDLRIAKIERNLGFAGGNNFAAGLCESEYLLLLNSDAILKKGALQDMLALAKENPRIGLVGARLENQDGSFQASYSHFPTLWREFLILSKLGRVFINAEYPSCGPQEGQPVRVDGYVEGACILVRRSAYQQTGGLDTRFFMYAEDVDFCFRLAQAGWEIWYHPDAQVTHLGGGSSMNRKPQREADLYRSRVQFFRRHYGNWNAVLLKSLILVFTLIKWAAHGALRLFSQGKYGRQVVSPTLLVSTLKGI
jgi:GT2 family glycosyltransferase